MLRLPNTWGWEGRQSEPREAVLHADDLCSWLTVSRIPKKSEGHMIRSRPKSQPPIQQKSVVVGVVRGARFGFHQDPERRSCMPRLSMCVGLAGSVAPCFAKS